jgi:hypothetical protein
MHFAAITAAVIGVGGSLLSSSSAGDAADTQSEAATQAAREQRAAGREANVIADKRYTEGQGYLNNALTTSNAKLQPYAQAGSNALSYLGQLTRAPSAAVAGVAGKSKAEQARLLKLSSTSAKSLVSQQGYVDRLSAQLEAFQKYKSKTPSRSTPLYEKNMAIWNKGNAELKAKLSAATATLAKAKASNTAAQSAYLASKGKAAKAAVAEGDLLKNFGQAQFKADPTSGGRAAPDLMKNFGVADYKADARTGGKAPADLTRNFGLADFNADPGYQFRMDQGNRAVNNSAASQGGLLSGATLKAIQKYSQDLGSQEYQNASNRFNANRENAANVYRNVEGSYNANRENAANTYANAYNRYNADQTNKYNKLKGIVDYGQAAATNQAQYYQNTGANLASAAQNNANLTGSNLTGTAAAASNYTTQGANAQAAGQIGQAQAINQGLSGVSNVLGQYAGYNSGGGGNNSLTQASNYNPNYGNSLMPSFGSTGFKYGG